MFFYKTLKGILKFQIQLDLVVMGLEKWLIQTLMFQANLEECTLLFKADRYWDLVNSDPNNKNIWNSSRTIDSKKK